MGDWITRPEEHMVGVLLLRVADSLPIDDRDRPGVVTHRFTWHLAHVAVLAGNAFLGGRRAAILLPNHFELDPRMHRHLVAGHAEFALPDLFKLDRRAVYGCSGLARSGRHPILAGFRDHVRVLSAAAGVVHPLIDIARLDVAFAIDLAKLGRYPVAGDAGDAFA